MEYNIEFKSPELVQACIGKLDGIKYDLDNQFMTLYSEEDFELAKSIINNCEEIKCVMLEHKNKVVVDKTMASKVISRIEEAKSIKSDNSKLIKESFMGLDLDEAFVIINAARAKATELNTPMNIAVVDLAGRLKAFVRMDDAWIGSIDIAQSKAFTAIGFSGDKDKQGPLSTKEIGELSQDGQPLSGIEVTNKAEGVVKFAGGIPVYKDDYVVGAIGVSGSTVENDELVAQAGADALKGGFNQPK